MDELTWDELELREIITFAPPGGVLRPGDYPWLAAVQICLKGGDGGMSGSTGAAAAGVVVVCALMVKVADVPGPTHTTPRLLPTLPA